MPLMVSQCYLCEAEENVCTHTHTHKHVAHTAQEPVLLECVNRKCRCISHIKCLAILFLKHAPKTQLLPTHGMWCVCVCVCMSHWQVGKCPRCSSAQQWSDLVSYRKRRVALEERAKRKQEKEKERERRQDERKALKASAQASESEAEKGMCVVYVCCVSVCGVKLSEIVSKSRKATEGDASGNGKKARLALADITN